MVIDPRVVTRVRSASQGPWNAAPEEATVWCAVAPTRRRSQQACPTAPKEVWYEGGLLPKEVCFATPGRAAVSRLPDFLPELPGVELSHKGVGACAAS